MITVTMPKLGLTMKEGTIVEWHKKEGDAVQKGETLFVLETEKVSYEVEAPEAGVLGKIVAQVGDVVPVGGVIAYILQPGETPAAIPGQAGAAAAPAAAPATAEAPAAEALEKVKISPLARRIAEEHNINMLAIKGTGPEGRIVKEDVLKAIEEAKAAPAPAPVPAAPPVAVPAPPPPTVEAEEELRPLSSMRKVIAERMTETFTVPHFYLTIEVDTTELGKLRQALLPAVEAKTGVRLTVTDLLIKVVARSLEENPSINCQYADGSVRLFKRIDIGLVTSVEGGLIVPVIRQANKKTLAEISKTRSELAQKARDRKLVREEMTGSTFTVSNLGMFGIDQFSALLQPPESAILAVGATVDKPVARDGQVVIRPMMTLTLSIDHRVLDGVAGANFLQSLKRYIESPGLLLL
ncbi:MAG: 2-oxo acid dehydrogenase subunit E2 [Chloroflexi bacterium]|nr:2-oxo acid dehydrogenase subunit E2 [Chloroflexota bacterium]